MIVYVTTMYRWGDIESHSYLLGTYSTEEAAKFAGECEKSWRGGKYEYQVLNTVLDTPVLQEVWENHMQCK